MVQLTVQLILKSLQRWGIHRFPVEITPVADCSHCERFALAFILPALDSRVQVRFPRFCDAGLITDASNSLYY